MFFDILSLEKVQLTLDNLNLDSAILSSTMFLVGEKRFWGLLFNLVTVKLSTKASSLQKVAKANWR
jgi:hypothetical protein